MLKNFSLNFNNLKKEEKKSYYMFAIFSMILFSIINSYFNPNMKNAPVYKEFIIVYSLFIETISAGVESLLLTMIIKIFIKQSKLKNIYIGLFAFVLLINCSFGILGLIPIIVGRVLVLNYISKLFHMFFKCLMYFYIIKKNFGMNLKATIIGILLIITEHIIIL